MHKLIPAMHDIAYMSLYRKRDKTTIAIVVRIPTTAHIPMIARQAISMDGWNISQELQSGLQMPPSRKKFSRQITVADERVTSPSVLVVALDVLGSVKLRRF